MPLNAFMFLLLVTCTQSEPQDTFKSPATVRTMYSSHANTILRITYILQSCTYILHHGVWFTLYYNVCGNTRL